MRRPPSQKVSCESPDDLDRAGRQAARKGKGHQTYMKTLLREGLDRQGRGGQEFPDYLTQGESLEDLQVNLKDLFDDLSSGVAPGVPGPL